MSALTKFRILIPKGQRWKWVVVAGLGITLAFAESVAAVSIAVLIDAMMEEGSSLELPVIGDVSDYLPGADAQEQLRTLALVMIGFFIFKAFLMVFKVYAEGRVAENSGARLATALFRGYLTMPYPYHLAHNSAELIRNASWAADEVARNYLKPIASITTQAAMLIFLLGVLIAASPVATLVAIGILVPVTLLVLRLVKPTITRLGVATKRAVQEALFSLQQSLHGVRDVKVLGRERFFGNEYRKTRLDLARARYMHPAVSEIPKVSIETLLIILVLGAVGLGGAVTGNIGLPVLGLYAYAGLRMMPAISSIVSHVNKLRYGSSIAETISEDLMMVSEATAKTPKGTAHPLDLKDAIRFEGVCFEYEADEPVLHDIDLAIRKGETVGIVGETGAGKSTLLDLILGLLEPTKGRITIDGADLVDHARDWQASIGLVPQSIYLLDDSIRRNIAYGLPDQEIDEESVQRAAKMAQLDSFIRTLPHGYETKAGERGLRLSGGQLQRVAIARALYRDPETLILDEGTASLDNKTEAELMDAIEQLRGRLTIIMVAHRLSTVVNCDRILLMSDGRIADEGTYEELRDRNVEFRRMSG